MPCHFSLGIQSKLSLFQNPVGFGTGWGKKLFQKLKFWNSLN
jgi:hypothetical protein